MTNLFSNFFSLLKETAKEFAKNNPLLIGAAISFYVVLSSGPILVILIFSLGSFYGEKAVEGRIITEIENFVGEKPAAVIQTIIERAYKFPSKTITLVASIPLLFFGGTMIFYQLRNTLNLMWGIVTSKKNGIQHKLKNYSQSILMLIIFGIIIFLLVIKTPALIMIKKFIDLIVTMPIFFIDLFDIVINILILTLLFGLIYRLLPAINIKWSDVWIGASVTSIFFTLVQFLIGINFQNTDLESAAGAIGLFTILILWIFYSSLIFLFGANFTKVYAKRYGSFIDSKKHKK